MGGFSCTFSKKNGALWQGLCLNDLPGPGKAPASRPAKGREAGYLRRVLRTASLSAPTAKWDSLIIYEGDLCVPRIRPHASWGGSSSLCLSEFGLRWASVGLRLFVFRSVCCSVAGSDVRPIRWRVIRDSCESPFLCLFTLGLNFCRCHRVCCYNRYCPGCALLYTRFRGKQFGQ